MRMRTGKWRHAVGAPGRNLLTPLASARLRALVKREPELEPWQIAERFGLSEEQAKQMVWHARRWSR